MATFAVFMHTMLSAALDASFLASIVQNEEGMFIPDHGHLSSPWSHYASLPPLGPSVEPPPMLNPSYVKHK